MMIPEQTEQTSLFTDTEKKSDKKNKARVTITSLAAIKARPKVLTDRQEKDFYEATKEQVWYFERENFQYLVIYQRNRGWWQCGDNSAMIYYYSVVPQLKIQSAKLWTDGDYTKLKWKTGCVIIKDIQKLGRRLVTEMDYEEVVRSPEVKVFKLPKPIPKEQMEIWGGSEENRKARFNALAMPKNLYPKIMAHTTELHREVVAKVAKLDAGRRECYGREGMELAGWLSMGIIKMSNERQGMTKERYFTEALEKLDSLNDWLVYVNKFGLFNSGADLRIAQRIRDTKAAVKFELDLMEKKDGAER